MNDEITADVEQDFVVSFTPSGVQAVLSNGWFAPWLEMGDDGRALARMPCRLFTENGSFLFLYRYPYLR